MLVRCTKCVHAFFCQSTCNIILYTSLTWLCSLARARSHVFPVKGRGRVGSYKNDSRSHRPERHIYVENKCTHAPSIDRRASLWEAIIASIEIHRNRWIQQQFTCVPCFCGTLWGITLFFVCMLLHCLCSIIMHYYLCVPST